MAERNENPTLSELRSRHFSFSDWLKKHCGFLFNIRSLFYFFWLLVLLGLGWMAYGLLENSGTQFYPWTDYFGQYVTMTYYYRDVWHKFFRTGYFELYSSSTYLGSDNIGSNSYYGLFDPFLIICYIFPRSWIPQTFAIATIFKGVAGGFAMRAYLKYMGVSERSSRLGALAFAFNGYVNFFVGFPSFVSMAFTMPLLMLGIEKIIKEKKPLTLVIALFLLGIISFFFLVVGCIWGVLYALWRYFTTFKTRSAKDNWKVIGLGVSAFAVGISLSAWTLLPSIRESALSGRTTSIASAYLNSLKTAFVDADVGTIFARLFEMVGRHPVREMQALQGFFYPTIGYYNLPLADGGYDAWTSSLFCYTPFVLLFFIALTSSVKRRKWSHLVAFAIIAYFLFTNFAYYMFYAFTGDGYGRWYIVLIPVIIYYGAQELDRLKDEPKAVIFIGEAIALLLAVLTWLLTLYLVRNVSYDERTDGYFRTAYDVPTYTTYRGFYHSALWVVYFTIGYDALISIIIFVFYAKKYLWKILSVSVILETIIWGNCSFAFCGIWRVDDVYSSSGSISSYGWNGGNEYREFATEAGLYLSSNDNSYFRTFLEGSPENNAAMAFGTNGTSNFHSLFNYDVNQLSRYIHANRPDYYNYSYAYGEKYTSHSWSAFYGNKRAGTDFALGIKYYGVRRQGYGEYEEIAKNVPFGSELVYGDETSILRYYKNPYVEKIGIGHAVDNFYKQGKNAENDSYDDFYINSGKSEILRNDEVLFTGAIIQDEDEDSFLEEGMVDALITSDDSAFPSSPSMYKTAYCKTEVYTSDYAWWGPEQDDGTYAGPTYFVEDYENGNNIRSLTSERTYIPDKETVVLSSTNASGYFNDEEEGAIFALEYPFGGSSTKNQRKTRVYFIGDNENGENQILSYDYETLVNYADSKISGVNGSDVFCFYPEGKVKYICFNAKPSDFSGNDSTASAYFPNVTVSYMDRSDYEEVIDKYASEDYALQNQTYNNGKFTFDTSFASTKGVVTSLGYDAGWHVKATFEDGTVTYPSVYKFNGGFVGFIAPAGEVSYELYYETPYLRLGAGLAICGTAVISAYQIFLFVRNVKKEKRELEGAATLAAR